MPDAIPSHRLTRRDLLAAAAAAAATRLEARARPTNILFILADDLGYGDLGCYGQRLVPTPNLDALAREGRRYTDCYAGSTVCAPSRCCLMTGRHTGHAFIRGNARVPLRPQDVTVAEVLKEAGYTTGLIGKWGLGEAGTTGAPTRQGFDTFFGYLNQVHAHNYYPSYLYRGEEREPTGNVVPNETDQGGGVASEKRAYSHELFTREAEQFLRRQAAGPFFLYLAYTIPHANNEAGAEGMEVPDLGEFAARDWPPAARARAAMITRLDRDIGRLRRVLQEQNLARNTLVIFTSDNGPHREAGSDPSFFRASGPFRGIKRDLYEGGIRVPMIAWQPGSVPAGTTGSLPWAFWDFLPTAAELAGVAPPDDLDGVSVLADLYGRPVPSPPPYQYWEFHERGFHQAIRLGRLKAVRHGMSEPLELYDLAGDPAETTDIATANPALVGELERLFADARTESAEFPVREG